jgi:membrane-associated phospholipid phosphatase
MNRSGECRLFSDEVSTMRSITLVLVTLVVVFARVPVQAQPRVVADVGQYSLPAMALLIAAVHDDGDGVIDLMQSLSVAWAATWGLKVAVDARRPNGGGRSFPSAHTTVAFASATHIWKRYGWKWGAPAAAAATLVATSRVDTRDHYVRDVLVGAAIGTVSSMLFTSRRVTFAPVAMRGGGGIFVRVGN